MTDQHRIYDTVPTASHRQFTPKEFIPMAAFDAMTHAEQCQIVNVAPLMAAVAKAVALVEAQKQESA